MDEKIRWLSLSLNLIKNTVKLWNGGDVPIVMNDTFYDKKKNFLWTGINKKIKYTLKMQYRIKSNDLCRMLEQKFE